MLPNLTLVRGDSNYFLEFEVLDADGEIVNLTGCSLRFKAQRYNESTLTLDIGGNVVNGTLGICQCFVGTQLSNKEGEFIAELQITWPTGKILTAPNISLKILKDLPR